LNKRFTEIVDDVIYNNNHNNNYLKVCRFIPTGILVIIFWVRMLKQGCKKKLLDNKHFFQFSFRTLNICAYIPRYHHHQNKYLLSLSVTKLRDGTITRKFQKIKKNNYLTMMNQ